MDEKQIEMQSRRRIVIGTVILSVVITIISYILHQDGYILAPSNTQDADTENLRLSDNEMFQTNNVDPQVK